MQPFSKTPTNAMKTVIDKKLPFSKTPTNAMKTAKAMGLPFSKAPTNAGKAVTNAYVNGMLAGAKSIMGKNKKKAN